jgi:hypothetical protein
LAPLHTTAGDFQKLDATDAWKGKTLSQVEGDFGPPKTIKRKQAGTVLVYDVPLGLADTWIALSRPPDEFPLSLMHFSQMTTHDGEVFDLPGEDYLRPLSSDPFKWTQGSPRKPDEVSLLTAQWKFYMNENIEVERVVVKYPKTKAKEATTKLKRYTSWTIGNP